MLLSLLHSKLHHARVTSTDVNYEGSILIDASLLEMARIRPFEKVHVWDVDNGNRFETYAIEGGPGSGDVMVNGAAAHLVEKGDKLIVCTFGFFTPEEAKSHRPTVVLV